MASQNKIAEMQKLFQSSTQYTHMQGKNPAVNRVATVVVPCMIGAGALVMLFNGCHKLYTGTGKME